MDAERMRVPDCGRLRLELRLGLGLCVLPDGGLDSLR
jgi:hypothetical protein